MKSDTNRRNLIAQWAFHTRPVLGRFHLWLEDISFRWLRGGYDDNWSFVPNGLERCLVMTAGVTALGTRLFGRFGEGAGQDKTIINQVKKDADAMSAYALSEGLWHLSRNLPENHAIMVCLGEGLMPKAGETPDMGSNPLLGFGRVYARAEVARFLDRQVQRMISDPAYRWDGFYRDVEAAGITVWGAAVDTLENTGRFADGADTGPLTVLHLFDQPLAITRPYEGYIGTLTLPGPVARTAEEHSVLLNFLTPRARVMEMIEATYPGLRRENVHVWTLRGKARAPRLGRLWESWQELGAHLVTDEWVLPTGARAFTSSGTYAPTFLVGSWKDAEDRTHVFLCDGYAASAEAMQAASLGPVLGVAASMAVFSSRFELPLEREHLVMRLAPDDPDLAARLAELFGKPIEAGRLAEYRAILHEARLANLPLEPRTVSADDFFPKKKWRVLAIGGYMQPDPYSGAEGVKQLAEDSYQVTVRASTVNGDVMIVMALRFMEKTFRDRWLVFNPLLDRFLNGEDYRNRAVKISDSGRIRNELQTLISQALEHHGDRGLRVRFAAIPPDVLAPEKQVMLREILSWYKEHHPIWFEWLELG